MGITTDKIEIEITFPSHDKEARKLLDELEEAIHKKEPIVFNGKEYIVTSLSVEKDTHLSQLIRYSLYGVNV